MPQDTEFSAGSQSDEVVADDSQEAVQQDPQEQDTQANNSNDQVDEGVQQQPDRDGDGDMKRYINQNNGLTRKVNELNGALREAQAQLQAFKSMQQQPPRQQQQAENLPWYKQDLRGKSPEEIGALMDQHNREQAKQTVKMMMEEMEISRADAERKQAEQHARTLVQQNLDELRAQGMNEEQYQKLLQFIPQNLPKVVKWAYNELFGTQQQASMARQQGEKLMNKLADNARKRTEGSSPVVNPASGKKRSQSELEATFDKIGPAGFRQQFN